MAQEISCDEPLANQWTWDKRVVDVLKVQSTKEYVEYRGNFEDEPADYKFEIPDIDASIQRGETELIGQIFRVPSLDVLTQIKCVVSFFHIKLSVTMCSLAANEMPRRMPANIMASIEQSEANDIVLTCNVKSSCERKSSGFYTFCSFNYVDRIQKSPRNSLVLRLYLRDSFQEIASGVLRWKVDCSNMDMMDELGVSPFFYADPEGFRAQIRLFLRGEHLAAEFRFLKRMNVNANCQFLLKLILVNALDARLNLVHEFNFNQWYKPEFIHACSSISQIANVKELLPFLNHNKQLMVKAKLNYF